MTKCTLRIRDEVNVRFEGLAPSTRRKLGEAVKFFLPHAYHMPAYKLGRWDGCVRFCDVGGRTYLALLDILLPIVMNDGYEIDLVDERSDHDFQFKHVSQDTFDHIQWPQGHPAQGEPIILRDYQVEAINRYLDNPQSIQEIATGAGKTLITAALSSVVEPYGRSIVIVPTRSLVTQTEADYLNMGLDVGVLYGDRKEYHHKHTICTWQSIESLVKDVRKGKREAEYDTLMEDQICVMVDEVHSAKADVLKDQLSSVFRNQPIRWGLTGTIPKEEHHAMGVKCTIGSVVGELGSKELQDMGVLADLDINVFQLQDGVLGFNNYQQELKWLTTDPDRIEAIGDIINKIAQGGNTLVLVDRIQTGEMLTRVFPHWVFVSGDTKESERKEIYHSISEQDNRVVVATYGVAAVGINIPRLFNLALLEPGKSFVRVIQSIGRSLRKAKDKDYAQVFDICSNLKYSKRHLTKRKQFYREKQFRFKVTKIEYR